MSAWIICCLLSNAIIAPVIVLSSLIYLKCEVLAWEGAMTQLPTAASLSTTVAQPLTPTHEKSSLLLHPGAATQQQQQPRAESKRFVPPPLPNSAAAHSNFESPSSSHARPVLGTAGPAHLHSVYALVDRGLLELTERAIAVCCDQIRSSILPGIAEVEPASAAVYSKQLFRCPAVRVD